MKINIVIFSVTSCLILLAGQAGADKLYETDLLKQDLEYKDNPYWASTELLNSLIEDGKKEPERKFDFVFDIASVKAHQGKFKEALADLNTISDESILTRSDFLEERAEIKSQLGMNDAALQDMDAILNRNSGQWQTWMTLWHKASILEKAGKKTEAVACLREALANLNRFNTDNVFSKTLLKVAASKKLTASQPDAKQAEQVLSLIRDLYKQQTCPKLSETLNMLGLADKVEKSLSQEKRYTPSSVSSPLHYVTITPDGAQIRLFINTSTCLITPEMLRKNFEVGTEQEVYPGSAGGCGPGSLALYPKNSELPSMFIFDAAKTPGLCTFFISYKKESNGS